MGVKAEDIGFDDGLGADGSGDDVAQWMLGGLGGCELAGPDLIFDKGVVVREAGEVATTEEVGAAVADMREGEGVW